MKKTGYEIIGMIKDGNPPKKIKTQGKFIYKWNEEENKYEYNTGYLNMLKRLNDEFEILEEQKVWKPKYGEEYYFIGSDGSIYRFTWCDNNIDNNRYELGNCFKTEKQAEKALEKIKIYIKLKRYAEEHNTEKIDWNNNKQLKWSISCYIDRLEIYSTNYINEINVVYFTSKEITEQAIEEIGEENIKKLFEDLFEDKEEKDLFDILEKEDIEKVMEEKK